MSAAGWDWPAARVTRVIDGDTLDAEVTRDLGFGGRASFTVRLRLNRINAPALTSAAGRAARDWLVQKLNPDTGWLWDITTLKPYKYGGPQASPGEWMAEVTHLGTGNVADVMVAAGHAVYWDGAGPRPADGTKDGA